MNVKNVLKLHKKWLEGLSDGIRADLSGADLRSAKLSGANLTRADLSGADLSDANLRYAKLIGADMRYTNLNGADLSGADLSGAKLSGADLRSAKLIGADLRNSNLTLAKLSDADLSGSDMRYTNLSDAYLRYAKLIGADMRYTNLNGADLSGAKGLLSQSDYIKANFKTTDAGIIVYKTFSEHYSANPNWKIELGQYITENVNYNCTNSCGCGVNVGTLEYIINNTKGEAWECLIEWADLAGVVVPYGTDGKIRAERVKLIRPITRKELKGLIE